MWITFNARTSQYKQKLLFQFHKHHVPKGKSSRSKCNLSQMLFTPNNLHVKYFILLWVYQVLYIRFICYHTENIVHVHSDRTRTFLYISIQIRDLNPFSMVRLIYVL